MEPIPMQLSSRDLPIEEGYDIFTQSEDDISLLSVKYIPAIESFAFTISIQLRDTRIETIIPIIIRSQLLIPFVSKVASNINTDRVLLIPLILRSRDLLIMYTAGTINLDTNYIKIKLSRQMTGLLVYKLQALIEHYFKGVIESVY